MKYVFHENWRDPRPLLAHAHTHVTLSLPSLSASHTNLSDTIRFLPQHFWKQTSVSWHLTWLEYLCFTLVRGSNFSCVLRGPSRLHTTDLRSQRVQRCTSRGHRLTVKYFGSQKRWMRTGVLWDVFLVSLRHSGSRPNILRKTFFFSCLPANLIVVSDLEGTSCFLLHTSLPASNRHHKLISRHQPTPPPFKHTHAQKHHRRAFFHLHVLLDSGAWNSSRKSP